MLSSFRSTEPQLPLLTVAALFAIVPTQAAAQDGAATTAQGRVTTEIVAPLRITAVNDLDFGCLVARDPGEVAISASDGGAIYSGGVRAVGGASCAYAPARFTVSGSAGREYRFMVDPAALASHESFAGETLVVRELVGWTAHPTSPGNFGVLDASGLDQLSIGGTLEVPVGARPGRYRARITVTVAYM